MTGRRTWQRLRGCLADLAYVLAVMAIAAIVLEQCVGWYLPGRGW